MSTLFSHGEHEDLGQGRVRTTLSLKSVCFERNGIMRRMTNLLGNSGDPVLPIGSDELLQFRIRDRLSGNAPVLHLGHGQDMIRLTPLDTRNVNGVVKGNRVTFPEAWLGADYVLELGGHLVRKTITLRLGHPRTLAFRVDAHTGFDPVALTVGKLRIQQPTLEKDGIVVPLRWLVTQQGGKWVLSVMLPAGDWANWVFEPTLTLQPAAADGKDTILRQVVPTTNQGASTEGRLGWYSAGDSKRMLLQYDVSSIPSSATVQTSVLTLTRAGNAGTQAYTFGAYQVVRAWLEGTGDYTESGDGATWNTYDGSNNWGTAGCDNVTTDRNGSAENAHAIDFAGDNSWSIPIMTQAWINNPASNKGVLLATVEAFVAGGQWNMYASDHATAAQRPKLVVEYTLPAVGDAVFNKTFSRSFRGSFG